jgi:hypothetical protein
MAGLQERPDSDPDPDSENFHKVRSITFPEQVLTKKSNQNNQAKNISA